VSAQPPRLAVGAIVNDASGRVLLIQRGQAPAQGRWTLPGGKVERGETLAQAVQRELFAETGVRAKLGPLVEVFEYIDAQFHYVILDYRMTEPEGEPQAGEDAAAARYFSLDEAAALETTDGLLPILRRVLSS
jgi:8-oxo-dGTP diphosphatase